MKLSVAERIKLLQAIPTKGDYATLKILTQLGLNLGLTEDEFKKWGVNVSEDGTRVGWKTNGVAEIPIGEVATGIIVDVLRKLDREQELPSELMGIYEKFIPTTE